MLEELLVYLTILSPLIAFALWFIKLKGKKWCILASCLFLIATLYLSFNPLRVVNVTKHLGYYTLFALVYIMLLLPKFGVGHFNKVLAISIFMLFIAGEWWELPVFVYDFIGKGFVADTIWWTSHIRRIYTLATFMLFTHLAQTHYWKPSIIAVATLGLGLFTLFLSPIAMASYPFLPTVARLLGMYLFGVMTLAAL